MKLRRIAPLIALALGAWTSRGVAEDEGWIVLIGAGTLDGWKGPIGAWTEVGDAKLDPSDPRRLVGVPGRGVLINDPPGKARNLVTKQTFGDVELHLEFKLPQESNSGVKLLGLYEIQLLDSHGVSDVTGRDNGGIYPRAELLPRYHHIDQGYPPCANASRPAGDWQTLDLIFQAPKFDDAGKKTANARFVKVALNGVLIHKDQEVPYPTGHAWTRAEVARGPLLLQADHGPAAFRNVRIRAWSESAETRHL